MFSSYLIIFAVVINGAFQTDIIRDDPQYLRVLDDIGQGNPANQVKLDVYYESFCPDSISFYIRQLVPLMRSGLAHYVDLHTYPYGKAKTFINTNGTLSFTCQHQEKECYGNKLHACAILVLKPIPLYYMEYNACLLAYGSNDSGANACGRLLNVNPEPIKSCAKSEFGSQLLKYYGDMSKRVTYAFIPHVVINGVPMAPNGNLKKTVCDAFAVKPAECTGY